MTTDEFLTLFALQICWYFTDTWEQFRISGFIDVIDGSNPEPVKLQVRTSIAYCLSALI